MTALFRLDQEIPLMATRAKKRRATALDYSKTVAPRLRWFDRDWPVLLLLALVTILVFAPACTSEFVSWDDNLNVSKNPLLNPPTWDRVAHFWKAPFLDLYVPVTYSLWALLAIVGRLPMPDGNGISLNPFIFHTANLIVHLVAVFMAYALLRRLVGKPWPAAAGALLFAIHPLQVEPVAWVTGLKDVLCGAMSLAALWQYVCFVQSGSGRTASSKTPGLRYSEDPGRSRDRPGSSEYLRTGVIGEEQSSDAPAHSPRRRAHYIAAMLLFIVALLAKPLAVVVPVMALLLDVWLVRRPWKKAIIHIAPMAVLAVGWMVLSVRFQTVVAPADGGRVLLRPLIAADALAFYFYKLLLPLKLGFHYDRAPMTVIKAGWLYYTWLAPAAILCVAVSLRKRLPWLLPALALFVVGVAPVLGLVPFSFQRYATVADRYAYLAMLGPAFALAAALAKWGGITINPTNKKLQLPFGLIAGVAIMLALFAGRSFVQTLTWQNDASLFANALKVNPRSAAAYNGMAGVLASERHPEESREQAIERLTQARDLAQHAVDLAPENPDGYITLGSIYDMMADHLPKATDAFQKAMNSATDAFRKAVNAAPDKPEALVALGGALAQGGNRAEAEKYLLRAIERNPMLAQAHLNLGMLYTQERRLDEALAQTRMAVGLDQGDPHARVNYATLLYYHGETDAALAQLNIARQIDSSVPNLDATYKLITRPRRPK
jgi:tetratricopeptide (TPR) repeat protein